MQRPLPPLNALRAFEAAARYLSLTRAAVELHVTPGALSHQIRGLEETLGVALFERRVRSIALTAAGLRLYPGLHTGFMQIRDAVDLLDTVGRERVLVVSTPPGFTAKWLAPRLHRFAIAHPEIDVRISSTMGLANFRGDGVHVAVRNLALGTPAPPDLTVEKLVGLSFVPVCSPKLIADHGRFASPVALTDVPLIHDDSLGGMPGWSEWFEAAGLSGVDLQRGHHFSSADLALDMVIEGAGVFLAHNVLAYDELRTGRLVVAYDFVLSSDRAYYFACLKKNEHPAVPAFRDWLKMEVAALDLTGVLGAGLSDARP
jgi:LysR family glycine cleavage system transcriptional activator